MYERFFGLVDTPFRLTPDPRYLFLSPKHAEALAHLKLGLRESSGFVCITGDVGTGKTTLLRAFLAALGPETATAYIFNPPLPARDGRLRAPPPACRGRRRPAAAHLHPPGAPPRASHVARRAAGRQHGGAPRDGGGLRGRAAGGERGVRAAGVPRDRGASARRRGAGVAAADGVGRGRGRRLRRRDRARRGRARVAPGAAPRGREREPRAERRRNAVRGDAGARGRGGDATAARGGARPRRAGDAPTAGDGAHPARARRRSRAAADAGRRGRAPPGEPRCAREHARRGRRDPRRLAGGAARRRRAGGSRAGRRPPPSRGPAAGGQREHAAAPRPARDPRAARPRCRPAARGRAHGHVGRARGPRRRRQPDTRRRRLPRPPLVRPSARLLARLRVARACLRARVARHARGAAAGPPPPHRRLRREGERAVRPCDRGCRARLPARALPGRRRPRRPADAHRPLRGRRRLPAADAGSVLVSSILDALKKLEAAEAPPAHRPAVLREPPRAMGLTAAGIALAFGAGAGGTFFLRAWHAPAPAPPVESTAPQPVTAPRPPPAAAPEPPSPAAAPEPPPPAPVVAVEPPSPAPAPPSPVVAEALPPAPPVAPLPQAAVDAEPPRARVAAAAPAPAPVAPPVVRPPEPRAVARQAEPPPSRAPAAAEDSPPGAESAPLPPLEPLPRLPAGAPHVQVSFLFYSPVAERRTVLLSVDGSSTETLHEGERAGDLEVARILPDRVHVRWSGQLFSVRARD